MNLEIYELSASEIASAVRSRTVSAVEVINAILKRIDALNPRINALVLVTLEAALDAAKRIDAQIASGEDPGPLAGVPFGVKDLEDVASVPTTFGSTAFRDHVADEDAPHVARLRAAGAIFVGKTNTPEFGSTWVTDNALFGATRNPWDLTKNAGGSSGGSAAVIASRMLPLATASDGGGSIRIPASAVGAFGIKPTFGTIPMSPSEAAGMQRWFDIAHFGPITRTVADAALYLDVCAGYHPHDPNSLPKPGSFRDALEVPLEPLRIGYSRDLGHAWVQDDIIREVDAAVDVLRTLGHQVEDLDFEINPRLRSAWSKNATYEMSAIVLPVLDEAAIEQLNPSLRAALESAARLGPADHALAHRLRAELNLSLANVFNQYDLIVTPTMQVDPVEATEPRRPLQLGPMQARSFVDALSFTMPFNLSGHPAATLRAGFSDAGLPCGLQLVAERHRDDLVLRVAHQFHQARPLEDWPQIGER